MQEKVDSTARPKSLDEKIKEIFAHGFNQYDRAMRDKLYFNMSLYNVTSVEFTLANGEEFIAHKAGIDGELVTKRKAPDFFVDSQGTKLFLDMEEVRSDYLIKSPKIYYSNEIKNQKGESVFKYVITQSGQFLLAKDKDANHNDIARGEPVLTAGSLFIRDGIVTEITSMSGRYRVYENDVRSIKVLLEFEGIEVNYRLPRQGGESNLEKFLEAMGIIFISSTGTEAPPSMEAIKKLKVEVRRQWMDFNTEVCPSETLIEKYSAAQGKIRALEASYTPQNALSAKKALEEIATEVTRISRGARESRQSVPEYIKSTTVTESGRVLPFRSPHSDDLLEVSSKSVFEKPADLPKKYTVGDLVRTLDALDAHLATSPQTPETMKFRSIMSEYKAQAQTNSLFSLMTSLDKLLSEKFLGTHRSPEFELFSKFLELHTGPEFEMCAKGLPSTSFKAMHEHGKPRTTTSVRFFESEKRSFGPKITSEMGFEAPKEARFVAESATGIPQETRAKAETAFESTAGEFPTPFAGEDGAPPSMRAKVSEAAAKHPKAANWALIAFGIASHYASEKLGTYLHEKYGVDKSIMQDSALVATALVVTGAAAVIGGATLAIPTLAISSLFSAATKLEKLADEGFQFENKYSRKAASMITGSAAGLSLYMAQYTVPLVLVLQTAQDVYKDPTKMNHLGTLGFANLCGAAVGALTNIAKTTEELTTLPTAGVQRALASAAEATSYTYLAGEGSSSSIFNTLTQMQGPPPSVAARWVVGEGSEGFNFSGLTHWGPGVCSMPEADFFGALHGRLYGSGIGGAPSLAERLAAAAQQESNYASIMRGMM